MHLNAFIGFIEDNWTITAGNNGFFSGVSLDFSHLGEDSADVACLGTPERTIVF